MREKKYANVLLEDEDKEKLKKISDNTEEIELDGAKLSLTRELKFKELLKENDDISLEDLNKELNEDYDLTDTSERAIIKKKFEKFTDITENSGPSIEERDEKGELIMPKVKGEKRIVGAYTKHDEDGEVIEEQDDDIYLTTAFKPLKKRFKISKLIKILVTIIVMVALIFSVYYYFVKPVYNIYVNSKPDMIFNNTIDKVSEDFSSYGKLIFNNRWDSNNDTDIYAYIKSKSSNIGDITDSNFTYTINKLRDITKDVIKEEKITSKSDTIEVRNEEIKVIRNTLELDSKTYNYVIDTYITKIFEDKVIVDTLCNLLGKDSSTLRNDILDNKVSSDNFKTYVNIYTKKGVEVVGFDIEEDGFRKFYWYQNKDGDFELYLNDILGINDKVSIIAINNNDNKDLRVRLNSNDIGSITINNLDKNKIDIDYNLKLDDTLYKGKIK